MYTRFQCNGKAGSGEGRISLFRSLVNRKRHTNASIIQKLFRFMFVCFFKYIFFCSVCKFYLYITFLDQNLLLLICSLYEHGQLLLQCRSDVMDCVSFRHCIPRTDLNSLAPEHDRQVKFLKAPGPGTPARDDLIFVKETKQKRKVLPVLI